MILCKGKEIGVQFGVVARRLWCWPWSLLIAPLLLMALGPAAVAAARTPPDSAVYGAATSPLLMRQSSTPRPGLPGAQGDLALMPDVRAGFDGLAKAGRGLVVRAIVATDGPPIDGHLRLTVRTGGEVVFYTQRAELATRARKQFTFQVPGPSGSTDLSLSLVVGDDDLVTRDVPLRLLSPGDMLVGLLSDDGTVPAGLGAVRRGGAQVSVAPLAAADVPADPLALQALDVLVVRHASSDRLTTDQRAALRTWVEQGGQLVVAGGPGWQRTTSGLDDLLPVAGLSTGEVGHLRAFSTYAGSEPPAGDVLVTRGTPTDAARVLLTQDGTPLLTERWLGLGRVTFVGADPALEPFRSWPAAETLWQRIIVGGRPGLPAMEVASSGGSTVRAALGEMLDLGLPAVGWVVTFLLGYVVVVGPMQYAVLRRWDRREWAWVGFPALAVGAVALLLGMEALIRGPDVRLAALSVVRLAEDAQTAPVDTYVGLAAPARGVYDLSLLDGTAPRPLPESGPSASTPITVEVGGDGAPTLLPQLRFEGRVQRALQLRTVMPVPAPIVADLRTAPGRIEGTVKNAGTDRLEDAIIIAGGEAIGLGDLPPGESRPVSIAVPTNRAGGAWQNGPPPWAVPSTRAVSGADRRRALISQVVQPSRGNDGEASGGVLLLAWGSAPLPRVAVGDGGGMLTGTAQRLIEQALPVAYGERDVVIPPGLLSRTVLDGTVLGRGGGASFVVRGPTVFQFDVPAGLEFARIDRLSAHLATPAAGGTNAPPRLSLYRWADRTWVDVPRSRTGVSNVGAGAAFVDGGSIRARVEPQGNEIQIDQLDLLLEGARP